MICETLITKGYTVSLSQLFAMDPRGRSLMEIEAIFYVVVNDHTAHMDELNSCYSCQIVPSARLLEFSYIISQYLEEIMVVFQQ